MKSYLFFGWLLFSLHFYCKGQVDLPSVEKVEFITPNYCPYHQRPDTVRIDLKQLKINDTIIISASFNDCGEWGGHNEHIYISRKNKHLLCWLKIDSCLCCHKLQKINYYHPLDKKKLKKDPLTDTITLHAKKKKLISNYFICFGHMGESSSGYGNISTDFSIVENGKELYFRKDPAGEWAGFTLLKKALFLK